MNKLFKIHWLAALCGLTMLSLTACNDDDNPENKSPEVNPDINVNVETYAGGELGTIFNNSASAYEDPTPATENAGMTDKFKYGEYFFERSYTQNSKPFNGLGPLYIRNSCMNCQSSVPYHEVYIIFVCHFHRKFLIHQIVVYILFYITGLFPFREIVIKIFLYIRVFGGCFGIRVSHVVITAVTTGNIGDVPDCWLL